MEFQRRNIIVVHLFLFVLIHTQIKAVSSFNKESLTSVDLKRHHLTETMSFPVDLMRRQLAGGGGGGGGGGSPSGGGGGGSKGSGSSGGSRGGGGGNSNRGGSGGGSGGSRGNKGGKGGGGGTGGGGDDGDGGSGSGSSGNGIPSPTQGGGRPVTGLPGGRFNSGGASLQYSFVLFIFITCLLYFVV